MIPIPSGVVCEAVTESESKALAEYAKSRRSMPVFDVVSERAWLNSELDRLGQDLLSASDDDSRDYLGALVSTYRRQRDICGVELKKKERRGQIPLYGKVGLDPAWIAELKRQADLTMIVEAAGVNLSRAGRNSKGCCPFHADANPSLFVYPDSQRFHCFGCGADGDAIDFLQRFNGESFLDSIRRLAQYAGVTLPSPGGAR